MDTRACVISACASAITQLSLSNLGNANRHVLPCSCFKPCLKHSASQCCWKEQCQSAIIILSLYLYRNFEKLLPVKFSLFFWQNTHSTVTPKFNWTRLCVAIDRYTVLVCSQHQKNSRRGVFCSSDFVNLLKFWFFLGRMATCLNISLLFVATIKSLHRVCFFFFFKDW